MGGRISHFVETCPVDLSESIASGVVTGIIRGTGGSTEHSGLLGGLDFAVSGKKPAYGHTMLDERQVIRPVFKRFLGNGQPNCREIGPEYLFDPIGSRRSCLFTRRA